MNLLRKGASPFVSFYLNAPKQGFVGLRTETVKVLSKAFAMKILICPQKSSPLPRNIMKNC